MHARTIGSRRHLPRLILHCSALRRSARPNPRTDNGNKGTDNGNKGTDNGNKDTDNGNKDRLGLTLGYLRGP